MMPYETIHGWKYTNRIYENHLFFRLCLIVGFFAVAPFCLGFDIAGWGKPQVLFVNFWHFWGYADYWFFYCGCFLFFMKNQKVKNILTN